MDRSRYLCHGCGLIFETREDRQKGKCPRCLQDGAEEEPNPIHKIMRDTAHFDCEPSIFRVSVVWSSHMTGYDAYVTFRTYSTGQPALSALHAHADTPEEALKKLLGVLEQHWGRCPHCGQHLHGGETEEGE